MINQKVSALAQKYLIEHWEDDENPDPVEMMAKFAQYYARMKCRHCGLTNEH